MVGSRVPLYSWPMRTDGLRSELRLVDGFFALELNRRPFLPAMVMCHSGDESIGGCPESSHKMAPPFPTALGETTPASSEAA